MDAAADRRRRMPVRVHHSFEAHERDDARYWAAIPPFIGRDAFIRNKRATGRIRDLGDIESLLD